MNIQCTKAGDGCLIEWFIADDPTAWISGVFPSPSRYVILYGGSNGLTINSNGNATVSGDISCGQLIVNGSGGAIPLYVKNPVQGHADWWVIANLYQEIQKLVVGFNFQETELQLIGKMEQCLIFRMRLEPTMPYQY